MHMHTTLPPSLAPCHGANVRQPQRSLSAHHGPLDQPGICTMVMKRVNQQSGENRQTNKGPLTPFGRQFWAVLAPDGRTYLSSLEQ